MNTGTLSRASAAVTLSRVVDAGLTLDTALGQCLHDIQRTADRGFVKELCFGVLRWFEPLQFLLDHYLDQPLKRKDVDIRMLILVGLYQLHYLDVAPHAAVSETVQGADALGKTWAKPLVNALLRRSQRERERLEPELERNPAARYSHPLWFIDKLKNDWPQQWQTILDANNQRPPQHLRVNRLHTTREKYLQALERAGIQARAVTVTPDAVQVLEPVDISKLPGFEQGQVSVQDAGAQLAAGLLDPRPGDLVLDACAAPGGKTAHILETQAQAAGVTALELDGRRIERLRATLARLRLHARVILADAAETAAWWDGNPFDRILLDAPCSATGVIRRHPDIKRVKAPAQFPTLQRRQARILAALWPLLKPGGRLLYSTCSVLPEENDGIIGAFLQQHPEADAGTIRATWGTVTEHGRQLLPGPGNTDGFYYSILTRTT